jgi:hypothetical protein
LAESPFKKNHQKQLKIHVVSSYRIDSSCCRAACYRLISSTSPHIS